MSLKQYFKVIDTPLAIVVGSVGAVLVTLQLGAVGMLAQGQMDRAAEREAGLKSQHTLVAQCLDGSVHRGYAACVRLQQRMNEQQQASYSVSGITER
jgi:hypothetical protein